MTLFTILLPVHRNADLITYAIKSVLAQTIQDFELFIICDGAPSDTVTSAQSFANQDHRISVFPFPKGERHGEAYRHIALQQAKGKYVAHIADDDFWFPNHLEEMSKLLQRFDFGNLTACIVNPTVENGIYGLADDLHHPATVQRMLKSKYNFFGLTTSGYTMAAYRRLSQGWSPAPQDIWTDLYMWRKFLRTEGLTFGTRIAVTACHFSAKPRAQLSTLERKTETDKWFNKMQCPEQRDQLTQQVLKKLCLNYTELQVEYLVLHREVSSMYGSLSWRMTSPLRHARKWIKSLIVAV